MLNAMEELMGLHPASRFGRWRHQPSGFEVFEELESRHPRHRQEDQAERREPTWTIGQVAAAAAVLVVLVGVLTLIARSVDEAPSTGVEGTPAERLANFR